MSDTEVHTEVGDNTNNPDCNWKDDGKKHRGWFMTWNSDLWNDNYNFEVLFKKLYDELKLKYIVGQYEIGKNGNKHIQFFIYYTNARTFSCVKKAFPSCWIKPCDAEEGIARIIKYCKKDDTRRLGPWEFGDCPKQGQRSDLSAVADEIIKGIKVEDLVIRYPTQFIKFNKGLKALQDHVVKDRKYGDPFERVWIWGAAGEGKSRYVLIREKDLYIKDGTKWWDNYNYEEAILIDDFDGPWDYRDFLRLLDVNKYQGQYKGGYVKINSPRIYITCEYPPEWYWQENELKQVTRRLTSIINIKHLNKIEEIYESMRTVPASPESS